MRFLAPLFVCFVILASCEINTPGAQPQPERYPVTDSADLRALRSLLDLNGLDTVPINRVAEIWKIGNRVQYLGISLGSMKLDTFHVPENFRISNLNISLSLRANRLMAWPSETRKIQNLTDLDISMNPLVDISTDQDYPNLTGLTIVNSNLANLNLSASRLTKLELLLVGGNMLTDIPRDILKLPNLKTDVYANRICSPSAEVDAFLKRYDRAWRQYQICPDPTP